jgi:hypothetical protein
VAAGLKPGGDADQVGVGAGETFSDADDAPIELD